MNEFFISVTLGDSKFVDFLKCCVGDRSKNFGEGEPLRHSLLSKEEEIDFLEFVRETGDFLGEIGDFELSLSSTGNVVMSSF